MEIIQLDAKINMAWCKHPAICCFGFIEILSLWINCCLEQIFVNIAPLAEVLIDFVKAEAQSYLPK